MLLVLKSACDCKKNYVRIKKKQEAYFHPDVNINVLFGGPYGKMTALH